MYIVDVYIERDLETSQPTGQVVTVPEEGDALKKHTNSNRFDWVYAGTIRAEDELQANIKAKRILKQSAYRINGRWRWRESFWD